MATNRPQSTRIARELQDVVAHGLSAIAVQAEAAQAALTRDPASVAGTLEAIRAAAHEALDDMRRVLDVMRDTGQECERMPQPGIAQIASLVARAQAAGQPVTLVRDGQARPLPASLELAAYRIVQEALDNACERAPGLPTTVRVTWAPAGLELEVADGGPGGRRAAVMRERARLHGGALKAGVGRRGGYRVRATFPA